MSGVHIKLTRPSSDETGEKIENKRPSAGSGSTWGSDGEVGVIGMRWGWGASGWRGG